MVRYSRAWAWAADSGHCKLTNCHAVGCGLQTNSVYGGFWTNTAHNIIFENCFAVSNYVAGIDTFVNNGQNESHDIAAFNTRLLNNVPSNVQTSSRNLQLHACILANAGTQDLYLTDAAEVICTGTTLASSTEVGFDSGDIETGAIVRCNFLNGVAGRHKTWMYGSGAYLSNRVLLGIISDHVTGGQAAGWAYGGSGISVYMDPKETDSGYELEWEFLIPVTASVGTTLKAYVRKTSSGANCTLTCTIYDSDDNYTKLLDAESVTLTDSWAQYSATEVTPTFTGFCRVVFAALDGGTTGDIGIDSITIA
jgi:hypothetical protein